MKLVQDQHPFIFSNLVAVHVESAHVNGMVPLRQPAVVRPPADKLSHSTSMFTGISLLDGNSGTSHQRVFLHQCASTPCVRGIYLIMRQTTFVDRFMSSSSRLRHICTNKLCESQWSCCLRSLPSCLSTDAISLHPGLFYSLLR